LTSCEKAAVSGNDAQCRKKQFSKIKNRHRKGKPPAQRRARGKGRAFTAKALIKPSHLLNRRRARKKPANCGIRGSIAREREFNNNGILEKKKDADDDQSMAFVKITDLDR